MSSPMVRTAFLRRIANSSHETTLPSRRFLRSQAAISAETVDAPNYDDQQPQERGTVVFRRPRSKYYSKKYLRTSPSVILALRLRPRAGPLEWHDWCLLRDVARSGSRRLPVVTLQMMLRKDEERIQTSLSTYLAEPAQWRTRLNSLAFKGVSEEDINHWTWILSAPDSDSRVERLVSTDRPKPIFVLFQLLGRRETFRKPRSLVSLLDYAAKHHVRWKTVLDSGRPPAGAIRRSLDSRLNMTPEHFAMFLRLSVRHFLQLWPSALPSLARVVASYIESIRPKGQEGGQAGAYAERCRVFNYALQLFKQEPPRSPVSQMVYNWRAQKILLGLSTRLPRPLVIDRTGYKAVRRVMLALPKSEPEAKVAARLAKTWPPYRQEWDGLDERRRPQDDLSRSVKAGVLMQEAGYADDGHGRALSVLGGAVMDESPSIQTRSLSPKSWTGRHATLNVFSQWAARVKATRNAHEAWQMFKSQPAENIRPNFQVYAEMFQKLYAKAVPASSTVRPGDGRETFPVHQTNLSDFEKARTQPPGVEQLYHQMLHDGNRPVGNCLSVLIKNAPNLVKALQYLRDSGLDSQAISVLRARKTASADGPTSYPILRRIPLRDFAAYIYLLCRLQPRRGDGSISEVGLSQVHLIGQAIFLTEMRPPATVDEDMRYNAVWYCILQTLASPRLLVSQVQPQNQHFQDTEALTSFMKIFDKVRSLRGLDVVLFESLCNAVLKALRSSDVLCIAKPPASGGPVGILGEAQATLMAAFREITTSTPKQDEDSTPKLPTLYHDINSVCIQGYMRVLALLGDANEMVRVMHWLLDTWDDESVLEHAKDSGHSQHAMMEGTFTFFRAFVEQQVVADVMKQVEDKLLHLNQHSGCTWDWPSKEDVQEHIRYDQRPAVQEFWLIARSGSKGQKASEVFKAQ